VAGEGVEDGVEDVVSIFCWREFGGFILFFP